MANWFEDATKTLADDKLSWRSAILRVAGVLAGAAFTSFFPGAGATFASAGHGPFKKLVCPPSGQCSIGGSCSGGSFTNCANNPNTNCYCFTEWGGPGVCACNAYCSQVPTCDSATQCPSGSICIVDTGCNCSSSAGLCVPACAGPHKNCVLSGNGHAGPTAAPVRESQELIAPVGETPGLPWPCNRQGNI